MLAGLSVGLPLALALLGMCGAAKKYFLGKVCFSVPHRLEARLDYNAKVETLTREAEGSHCTGYAKTAAPHTFPFLNF